MTAGALAASALTGVAVAATNAPTAVSPAAAAGPQTALRMHDGMGPGGPGGLGGPDGHLLHGEMVVQDDDGTVRTVLVQSGEATAVSARSLTVRSSDGYEATYAVTADTVVVRDHDTVSATDVRTGDTVHVRAVRTGGDLVAEQVMALSPEAAAELEQWREEMQQHLQDGDLPPGGPGMGPGRGHGHGPGMGMWDDDDTAAGSDATGTSA
ncbi:MAG: hypothetical protein R2737_02780 [Candidatus Nanopelagicales bacterium]